MQSLYLPINIAPLEEKLELRDLVLSVGSCFSESIGQKLLENKVTCFFDTIGTIYHPVAIFSLLRDVLVKNTNSQIVKNGEIFYDYRFSSQVYGHSENELNQKVQIIENELILLQQRANWIIITPGTAWGYHTAASDILVANCHKQPIYTFTKKLTGIETILRSFESWWLIVKKLNPSIKILFTLSPVRHYRDGLVENNYSKSILHLSLREITTNNTNCFYFPAYEIMMDHLRDYRFYKTDRIHPTEEAIDIIWDYLAESWFSSEMKGWIKKWGPIKRSLAHRPKIANQDEYKRFLRDLLNKLRQLPYELVNEEIEAVQNKLDPGTHVEK